MEFLHAASYLFYRKNNPDFGFGANDAGQSRCLKAETLSYTRCCACEEKQV